MITTEYRNSRENVVGAGTIATHLIGKRFEAARALALTTNEIEDWQYGKTRAVWGDPFGNINERHPGSNIRDSRWCTAALASWDFFDLPHGFVWTPCYLCGLLFDAWTMDVEHVFGRLAENGGTRPGGILLACSGCNTEKGDYRRVAWQTREMLESHAIGSASWVRHGDASAHNFDLRPRRLGGADQSSTPYVM